jgi:hypothetical protein
MISTTSHYPAITSLNALISQRDFEPDFIATITTRELKDNMIQIVLDTGCTFAASPDKTDFITYHTSSKTAMVQTAGVPTNIVRYGIVEWSLVNEDGILVPIQIPCKHIPPAKMRLLSPQDFCQVMDLNQSQDQFGGNSNYFWFPNCR